MGFFGLISYRASNTNGFYLRAIARPTIPAQFRAIQGQ